MSYSSTKMADVFREPLSTRGFVTWAKKIRFCFKKLNFFKLDFSMQCLGSRSIGSARFWLPGSGSGYAKICGSTDSDPKSFFCSFWLIFYINQKLQKKTFLLLKPKSELLKKKRL